MRTKNIFLAVAMMFVASFAKAENVSIADFTITQGDTIYVPVALTNSHNDLTAFSMTLTLPEGLTIISAEPAERYQGGITVGNPDKNVYNVCGLDLALGAISGTDGTLFTLKVAASKQFKGGEGSISDIDFITTGRQHVRPDGSSFTVDYISIFQEVPGDVNGDGTVNVLDVTNMISYWLGESLNVFIFENGDINHDGTINVLDVTDVIDIILSH